MPEPYVGLPATDTGICGFGGADITGPGCTEQPTRHLLVRAAGWGDVALSACLRHEPLARASGLVLDEHPWDAAMCGGETEVWEAADA